jgi:hypothetical protein
MICLFWNNTYLRYTHGDCEFSTTRSSSNDGIQLCVRIVEPDVWMHRMHRVRAVLVRSRYSADTEIGASMLQRMMSGRRQWSRRMWNQTTSFMPSSIQSSTYCTEGLIDAEPWLDPSLDLVRFSGVL